ncbi:MAG TPA: hypothetical protein PKY15_02755, partial [Methanoregulaceae archaeon]|nr:hypothetical protein [Methanoregulaceae archaeon]
LPAITIAGSWGMPTNRSPCVGVRYTTNFLVPIFPRKNRDEDLGSGKRSIPRRARPPGEEAGLSTRCS